MKLDEFAEKAKALEAQGRKRYGVAFWICVGFALIFALGILSRCSA